ncbi:P-II family nitrogen regulator [Thiocystis violacea]|uniref:P-II family nitrogen regulator n=1 Tax=Thiocystis violacea TaxID=13725 RepID=UPI001904206A|nr:P-II family nitrogen regulator [Thiocystis violacea]MBK1717343.1 transcriptional regulator [Thiocystis violacea]
MKSLAMSAMKKIEIIVEGQHQGFVTDLLDRAGAGGYSILHNLSGKGTHGAHKGHLMFNDESVLVMIVSAVPPSLVDPILEGLTPFLDRHMGVVFTSDIAVSRMVPPEPDG